MEQHTRVHDDAVAYDHVLARLYRARWHQVELEGLLADDDGVASVVSPVEPDDEVRLGGVEVRHLPLALISPLGPYDDSDRHVNRTRIRFKLDMAFVLSRSNPIL